MTGEPRVHDDGLLLEVDDLHTQFHTSNGIVPAVRGVDFTVRRGETVGIVGESGCGKSVTMASIMRLLPDNGRIARGSIRFQGQDLATLSETKMQAVRGHRIGMIFQDPMTSLNPVFTVERQLTEHLIKHKGVSKRAARAKAVDMLDLVGIPSPKERLSQYPHEFSGGMRQRVCIAIALITDPALLIADEPTTALDVTIQAQILELLQRLRAELGTAIVLITHDLGVIAGTCDRVLVMYGGKVAEEGSVEDVFYRPGHPYAWGLLGSVPDPEVDTDDRLVPIEGQPPDLLAPPPGCGFAPRCAYAMRACLDQPPALHAVVDSTAGHRARCWLHHGAAPAEARDEVAAARDRFAAEEAA